MIQEVKLPEVSENIDAGDVVKVLVKVGDTIELEQPVIELETDKAMFEVPSTAKGKVTEILVKEGGSVKIGDTILKVETEGSEEDAEKDKKEVESKISEKSEEKEEEAKEKKEENKESTKEDKEESKEEDKEEKAEEKEEPKKEESKKESKEEEKPEEKKKEEKPKEEAKDTESTEKKSSGAASPSVRRLARELGVDIAKVKPSSDSGRLSEDDVKGYVKKVISQKESGGSGSTIAHKELPDFSKWGDIKKEPMSKIRRLTAESMTYAWTTIPMVTQFDKADITSLEEFRKKYGKTVEAEKGQLTVTSILVKVITAALKKFPQFNSSIDMANEEVIYKNYFNIGIAVDTERGLLVPVIKDADKKNITQISVELNELAEKTRSKKITPDEMDGGSFTISNLGGIGGTNFTPIVYSPQVAILGVSRASKEAVYKEEGFVPRFMLPLTLTYDHRIIDGADAARFLRWVCEALENPFVILLQG